jgi:glycosyltransferase involved in cell wall biosynthesis
MSSSNLKIVVVEPLCRGLEHVPFNLGFLEVLIRAFPGSQITFLGDDSQLSCVKDVAPDSVLSNVEFESTFLPPRNSKSLFRRIWLENSLFSRLVSLLRIQKSLVVFLSAPSSSIVNAYYRLPCNSTTQIQFVMHGGLSKLKRWRGKNPLRRLTDDRFLVRRMSGRNFRYILLERTIQKELEIIDKHLAEKSFVLEHPLPSVSKVEAKTLESSRPIKIGFLGTASSQKGFPDFCRLAHGMQQRNPGRYEFHVVGSAPTGFKDPSVPMSGLSTFPAKAKISPTMYSSLVNQLDLVAMPYNESHYASSPSGVLLDAIAYGKPVLANPYPAIVDLFERFGPFGILSPIESWECQLKEFLHGDYSSKYDAWKHCLSRIADSRTVDRLADLYRRYTSS